MVEKNYIAQQVYNNLWYDIPLGWFLVQKVCERVFGTWRNGRFSAFLNRFDWFSAKYSDS